jgi:hypothetical protein
MSNSNTFAERVWLAVSPEGIESSACIRVSAPKHQPRGEWAATVSIAPMTDLSEDIHGMDSWQAVDLAMRHAATRVQYFQSIGWRFYWDDVDRDAANAVDLFRGSAV